MEQSPMKLIEQLKSLIISPETPKSAVLPPTSPQSSISPLPLSPPILPDPSVAAAYEQMVLGAASKLLRLYQRQIWMNYALAFSSGISNFIVQMTGKLVTALLFFVIIAGGTAFLIFGIKSAAVGSVVSLIVTVCRSLSGN